MEAKVIYYLPKRGPEKHVGSKINQKPKEEIYYSDSVLFFKDNQFHWLNSRKNNIHLLMVSESFG